MSGAMLKGRNGAFAECETCHKEFSDKEWEAAEKTGELRGGNVTSSSDGYTYEIYTVHTPCCEVASKEVAEDLNEGMRF